MTGTRRIAITMGDPAGIGPEILLTAAEQLAPRVEAGTLTLVAVGTASVIQAAARRAGKALTLIDATGQQPVSWPYLPFVSAAEARGTIALGEVSAEAGRMACAAIEKAVELALAGAADAIVTGPISKEALQLSGSPFSGHTDMLAHLTGSTSSVMMLAHGAVRVSHVSTHIALARAAGMLTRERLDLVLGLTFEALSELGLDHPTVAVAALNPHAGEGGMFGREDIDISLPVIEAYRARGFDVAGPVPGDTVFVKAVAGQFDAVVAMYHDQGHIPIKMLGFRIDPVTGRWVGLSGINITLGLPIIRTSVDHGTAFDIAGRGIANPTSLIEAVDYAVGLAEGRDRNKRLRGEGP